MYLGRAHKTALTPPTHAVEVHTGIPGVGDLTAAAGVGTTDHSMLSHAGISGVGSMVPTTGGPVGTSRHDLIDHSSLGGVQVQSSIHHLASGIAFSSGALGFTPVAAIFFMRDITQGGAVVSCGIARSMGALQAFMSENNFVSNSATGTSSIAGAPAGTWAVTQFTSAGILASGPNTYGVVVLVIGQ